MFPWLFHEKTSPFRVDLFVCSMKGKDTLVMPSWHQVRVLPKLTMPCLAVFFGDEIFLPSSIGMFDKSLEGSPINQRVFHGMSRGRVLITAHMFSIMESQKCTWKDLPTDVIKWSFGSDQTTWGLNLGAQTQTYLSQSSSFLLYLWRLILQVVVVLLMIL